jgi:PHD/YefM family antitoxin component YafN of YafNO toxin-antitoxin module
MSEPTGDAPGKPFAVVDLDAADPEHLNLAGLHAQVLTNCGRIELLRRGGACVLISKDELDSLEKALEILSATDTVRMMRQEIALVARVATPRAQVPPPPQPTGFNSRVRSMNLP